MSSTGKNQINDSYPNMQQNPSIWDIYYSEITGSSVPENLRKQCFHVLQAVYKLLAGLPEITSRKIFWNKYRPTWIITFRVLRDSCTNIFRAKNGFLIFDIYIDHQRALSTKYVNCYMWYYIHLILLTYLQNRKEYL